jgi:uncharacterized protein YutE (UPF0331/DUF86 family)
MPAHAQLSPYELRLAAELDRILYQNYLTSRTITDFWAGDRDAVIAQLKLAKTNAIRSIVLMEYVTVDDALTRIIMRHLFAGVKKSQKKAQRRTASDLLDRLYPLDKINIVKSFREVPKTISSAIMAMNTLRNSFVHRFSIADLPKSKRLYKGKHDVYEKKGLETFKGDMWDVEEFLEPELMKVGVDVMAAQKAANRAAKKHREANA